MKKAVRKWPLRAGSAVAVVVAPLFLWYFSRDPLAALPRPEARSPPPAQIVSASRGSGRAIREVKLYLGKPGTAHIFLSLPDPLPARRLPVLFVMGGLQSGLHTLSAVPDPGDNAVAIFDWPLPERVSSDFGVVAEVPELRRHALLAPGQASASLAWLAAQPWTDPQRISLAGVSLGAFAAPAVQRLAAERGVSVGWTILAYGGAPIGDVIAFHPRIRPQWARPLFGRVADLLLRPVEPLRHLPHIRGRFLVLSGTDDTLIPSVAAKALENATPEPRTAIRFAGGHLGIGKGQKSLLRRIVAVSRKWLRDGGAIN